MLIDLQDLPLQPHRLTRARYDELVAGGVYDREHVELIAGVVVDMSPEQAPHAFAMDRLARRFFREIDPRACVRVQHPILAAGESEPEPDIALVPPEDYRTKHPDQALLVVEVADSSLNYDRTVKHRLYAASAFHEYWIVNLRERQVEVWRRPMADRYTELQTIGLDGTLTVEAFPDVQLPVAELF